MKTSKYGAKLARVVHLMAALSILPLFLIHPASAIIPEGGGIIREAAIHLLKFINVLWGNTFAEHPEHTLFTVHEMLLKQTQLLLIHILAIPPIAWLKRTAQQLRRAHFSIEQRGSFELTQAWMLIGLVLEFCYFGLAMSVFCITLGGYSTTVGMISWGLFGLMLAIPTLLAPIINFLVGSGDSSKGERENTAN